MEFNFSNKHCDRVIVIGSSTGGTEAVFNIMRDLPGNLPPILIVQHMPAVFTELYAQNLDSTCCMSVREARNGDLLQNGHALVAPGNMQMRLKKTGYMLSVECFKGNENDIYCPSVDVLFLSVASIMKNNAIGVILTGMGNDGAKGLLSMRNYGARTIGQNEESCVVYGMPKAAFEIGAVEKQARLMDISSIIVKLSGNLMAPII